MKTLSLALIIASTIACIAYGADSYTITTYYPAPNGKYDSLETNNLTCNNDTFFGHNVGIGTATNGTLTAQNLTVNDESLFSGDVYIDHQTNDPFVQFQRASGAAFWVGYNTGSSKFDIRTSSAATDQVFTVTRTGNVGIGVNGSWSPGYTLEVNGDAHITQATTIDGATTINNTATINGAATIVDNDLTISRVAGGGNAQVIFNNAGVNSAMGNTIGGEFRISPATNNITNANLILTANGLGINTTPGANALNVTGTANISSDTTFGGGITVNTNIITTAGLVRIRNVTLSQGTTTSGGVPVDTVLSSNLIEAPGYLHTSDARLKENVRPITNALAKVKALQGVSFNFKNQAGRKIGLVAQNVETVVPEVVATGSDGMKSVEYDSLVSLLIEAIKEQQLEIKKLKALLQQQDIKPGDNKSAP